MKGVKIEGDRLLILDNTSSKWKPVEDDGLRKVRMELEKLKKKFFDSKFSKVLKKSGGCPFEECLVNDGEISLSAAINKTGKVLYRYHNDGNISQARSIKEDIGFETEATEEEAEFLRSLHEDVEKSLEKEEMSSSLRKHIKQTASRSVEAPLKERISFCGEVDDTKYKVMDSGEQSPSLGCYNDEMEMHPHSLESSANDGKEDDMQLISEEKNALSRFGARKEPLSLFQKAWSNFHRLASSEIDCRRWSDLKKGPAWRPKMDLFSDKLASKASSSNDWDKGLVISEETLYFLRKPYRRPRYIYPSGDFLTSIMRYKAACKVSQPAEPQCLPVNHPKVPSQGIQNDAGTDETNAKNAEKCIDESQGPVASHSDSESKEFTELLNHVINFDLDETSEETEDLNTIKV